MLLVSDRDVLSGVSEDVAQQVVTAWLAEHPDPESVDRQALIDGLTSGRLSLVRLDERPQLLDDARVHDLMSLGPMDGVPEPPRPRPDAWVGVEVVDSRGRPLPGYRVQVLDPTGASHDLELDSQGSGRLEGLAEDGGCTFTLERREPS